MSLGGCMEKKEALEIIKKFVEGDLPISEFRTICTSNAEFRDNIKNCENLNIGKQYDYDILKMIDGCKWLNASQQNKIHLIFLFYLAENGIKDFHETELYLNRARELSDLVPDWLSDDAMEYVDENIINKIPNDLSDKEKKKWIRKKIKETFKFEKQPSEFAQSGIWPQDEDGNFLVFRKQIEDGEKVIYTFVNPNTKQEYTFEEMF